MDQYAHERQTHDSILMWTQKVNPKSTPSRKTLNRDYGRSPKDKNRCGALFNKLIMPCRRSSIKSEMSSPKYFPKGVGNLRPHWRSFHYIRNWKWVTSRNAKDWSVLGFVVTNEDINSSARSKAKMRKLHNWLLSRCIYNKREIKEIY